MSWGKKVEEKSKEFGSLCMICLIIFVVLGFAISNFYISGVLALVILLVGSLGILELTDWYILTLTVDKILIIVGFRVTAIGFVPLNQEMLVRRRKCKLNFEVERVVEGDMWSVRIRDPNKTVERLNILVETTKLIVEGSIPPFEFKIPVGAGQTFRIPLDKVNTSQEIIVIRHGDKVLKKVEFNKIIPVKS